MNHLPWRVDGARLRLPRDLNASYTGGRFGLFRIAHLAPLYWGSESAARFGFGRYVRLGLFRTFPRKHRSEPAWYSLTAAGAEWVADQAGCETTELRVVGGIRRTNLTAVAQRNNLWVSLVLACRTAPGVRLDLFRPEWELRAVRPENVRVVPDALIALVIGGGENASKVIWMVELDGGTERTAVWTSKAAGYAAARSLPRMYGASRWQVLAVVPSARRARNVAKAVVVGGAGAFTYVGVEETLVGGRAFDQALWRCADLAGNPGLAPDRRLIPRTPISEADQQPRSAVDRGEPPQVQVGR